LINSRCRLRKALSRRDKSRSSQVDRGLPYPPGRGTAGSTRICVGDTCSSEIVNDPRTSIHLRAQAVMRAFGEPSSVSSIQPSPFSTALPSAESGAILTLTAMHPRSGTTGVERRDAMSPEMGSGLLRLTEPREELAVRRELLLGLGPDAGGSGRGRRLARLARRLDGRSVRSQRRKVGVVGRQRDLGCIALEGYAFLTF
jgi:hypothetical protein